MEEPKLTEHALQAEPKPTAPDTHSNNQNRPIASDVPETRPKIKHPGCVAAGKKLAECNPLVREAKKTGQNSETGNTLTIEPAAPAKATPATMPHRSDGNMTGFCLPFHWRFHHFTFQALL